MNPLRMTLVASIAAVLAACGSEPPPEQQAQAAAAAAHAAKMAAAAKAAAADPINKMARAVGNGKPGAAADVRYSIRSKPQAGVPVEIEIVIVPNPGVDSLSATVTGMEGVTVAGELTMKVDAVEAKKPYTHTFSVLPSQNGVFYVTVAVDTQIGGSTMGRTFSIPFAVGDGAQPQKPAPQPLVKDASGQVTQPMPVTETNSR